MNKIIQYIILAIALVLIALLAQMSVVDDFNSENPYITNTLALTNKLSTKDFALKLIQIDKSLSIKEKIELYHGILDSKILGEYETFLIEKIIEKLEKSVAYRWDVCFTGTLCSGKSTIVKLFADKGYKTISEAAGDIIESQLKLPESERIVPWMGDVKRLKFQYLVASTQLVRELELKNEYIYFLDRGMPDGLAYLQNVGKDEETLGMFDFARDYCKEIIYKLVFYFEPTDALETTTIRTENDHFRMQIAKAIKSVYQDLGYKLVIVPFMTIQDRFEFIKLFVPEEKTKAERFEAIFESYESVKKHFDSNFEGFIEGFDWLKCKLLDGKDYKYKQAVSSDIPVKSTLNHILQSIKNVDSLSLGDHDKKLIRMVMFFHDFGKAISEPHEKNSKIICRNMLEKLDFDENSIKLIEKLVFLHNEIGKYPNPNREYRKMIAELSPLELYYLYHVVLCDEMLRINLDTKRRRILRFQIFSILYTQNDKEIYKLDKRLDYIHLSLRHNFDFLIKANWDMFYRLKEIFFEFSDIKIIEDIKFAA